MNAGRQSRSKDVHFRFTEDEFTLLEEMADNAGLTKTRYLTYLLEREAKAKKTLGSDAFGDSGEIVYVYPDEDIRLILWHLGHWGNNLNQATSAISKLARRESLSDLKNTSILMTAANEIAKCARAIDRIDQAVKRMRESRHIVMKD